MFSMDFRAGTLDTPKGHTIIDRLNGGIATLTDTRRQAIVLDHTTRRLYKYDLSDYLYQYSLIILLGMLLFFALAIITVLKRREYRMEQEEKMRRLMDHDALTGALSSNGFKKRVEELLRANPDVPYLLTYANIKDFKFVNDSLGREAGDDLLRFWVDRTQEILSDKEALGRMEGDHLGVLRLAKGDEQVRRDDEKVIESVRNFFVDRGEEYRVHVCGGVYVLTPKDYEHINVDRMLDCARVAEKRVRAGRDDGYEFYNPEQWSRGKRIADIVSHLPKAIQTGEIQVWYQPQVDYKTNTIVSAEALCRWDHAWLGLLNPAEFVPALEEHGLIHELDHYVWERVCQDLQRWNLLGFRRPVSVNLSRCDIQEDANFRATQTSKAVYGVYVPFDGDEDVVPVQRGMMFRGYQYGLLVAGKVIGVFPSQLGTFENYTERGSDVVPHHCRGYLARVEATDV
jgi:predicted signal transduction protein with EAL and GGDEF domain